MSCTAFDLKIERIVTIPTISMNTITTEAATIFKIDKLTNAAITVKTTKVPTITANRKFSSKALSPFYTPKWFLG